jgi:hypothetical protein
MIVASASTSCPCVNLHGQHMHAFEDLRLRHGITHHLEGILGSGRVARIMGQGDQAQLIVLIRAILSAEGPSLDNATKAHAMWLLKQDCFLFFGAAQQPRL